MTVSLPATALPPASRRIFTNRTLNLRALRAVGFDMDYTLIHYRTEEWERRAYEHMQRRLVERGWPVEALTFDPNAMRVGLILDLHLGNVLKANRFGYVKKAVHGTRPLSYEEQRSTYGRVRVDLSEPRWVFLNTLFALSEACMYAQVVDLFDAGRFGEVHGYEELYGVIRSSLDETHMEGELKAEIIADPDRFVLIDEDLPLALLDLKYAGKKLFLITNSEWTYTRAMMTYAFDRFLPAGKTFRDLFDAIVVAARKPSFFTSPGPMFEVVDEEGLLRPLSGRMREGGVYLGGHAGRVEEDFKLAGEDILYVGDHIFADVSVSKNLLRWRTALVLRELEAELEALESFKPKQALLTELMDEKEVLEHQYSLLRLAVQRAEREYGPRDPRSPAELRAEMAAYRDRLVALDERIGPLAREASELGNTNWGLLLRTGNDKSHLARQIERYADVYTSRVSNFLMHTPFVYLRSPRGSLPHDSGPGGGV